MRNYLQARREVQTIIKQGAFDLVHAQWGQSAVLALPKMKPLIVTFRGDDAYGIVGKRTHQTVQGMILKMVSCYAARIADERIVVSQELASHLALSDYHVIPSGIDFNKFRPMERQEARRILKLPDKKLVLFVGDHSNPRKRLPLIEEAVALVQASQPDLEFVCVNNIPHQQIPLYMNACDVLILASVREGSPNVVKEALACNLPVVSTDVGDVRERINAIEGCEICEDAKPETIAAALKRVVRRAQRVDSRNTVLDLDEHLLTQKVIDVYLNALEKQRK